MSTPYMNLSLPTVSSTVGPTWASELNTALEAVDAHDHSSGKGVPVPSAGLNINADVPFNSYNQTLIRSSRWVSQVSALALGTDLNCCYVVGGNLYFNDGSGNQIQLTAGGALNAASVGGIGGDYATSSASAFYTSASSKFTLWSAANTSAYLDVGTVTIRDVSVSSGKGATVAVPAGLSANYNLTLPTGLPGSQYFLTVDASGNIAAAAAYSGGIGTTQLTDGAVTQAKRAALGEQLSSSSSTYANTGTSVQAVTNLSVSITTTGRRVELKLVSDGGGSGAGYLGMYRNGGAGAIDNITIYLYRDGVAVGDYVWQAWNAGISQPTYLPGSAVVFTDKPVAGTYTYDIRVSGLNGFTNYFVYYLKLLVYEL